MKAILVIDEMPNSCVECPLFFGDDECYALKEYMPTIYDYSKGGKYAEGYLFPYKEKRLNWCPLKPMPRRKMHEEVIYAEGKEYMRTNAFNDYENGWNDCLDEIGGIENER